MKQQRMAKFQESRNAKSYRREQDETQDFPSDIEDLIMQLATAIADQMPEVDSDKVEGKLREIYDEICEEVLDADSEGEEDQDKDSDSDESEEDDVPMERARRARR